MLFFPLLCPQWAKVYLEEVGPGSSGTGWAGMLRHAMLLINGSGVVVRLMIWATPMRIRWVLRQC